MSNKHIDRLNKRLGDALGYCDNRPRFAWMYAPELYYFKRSSATGISFERICWAERLGRRWMLCQHRRPVYMDSQGNYQPLTREMWWKQFRGEFPYPERGIYVPHPETALMPGLIPDLEDTLGYIHALRRQMEMSLRDHYNEGAAQAEADSLEAEKQFYAEAEDWFPAFWKAGQAHEPGTRGAHVSFGGI